MAQDLTILIAEDDEEVAKTLEGHLSNEGYNTTVALDGEVALSEISKKNFDIVILDLKMPKVSGFEILRIIKQKIPATKVIVLTAYADFKNTEICKRLGADHVLAKPFDLEILFWTIEMVTKKPQP